MHDKDLSLFGRKVVESVCELRPDERAKKYLVRVLFRVKEKLFEFEWKGVVIKRFGKRYSFSLPIPVDDPIARNRKEPCGRVFDRLGNACAHRQLLKDILQNILSVLGCPHASPDEIETEIRAQLERAEQLGIPITHLDSHMGTLFARPDYFERFAKVGMEKGIPILAIGGHATYALKENPEAAGKLRSWIPKIWNAGLPVIDDLHTDSYGWKPEEKTEKLLALLKELKPGVTEILFHASIPTEDFPLITSSSQARLADARALTDPAVKKLILERGIILTTWKELKERRKKAGAME